MARARVDWAAPTAAQWRGLERRIEAARAAVPVHVWRQPPTHLTVPGSRAAMRPPRAMG